jgi:Ni/Co efflux regulator RcnB
MLEKGAFSFLVFHNQLNDKFGLKWNNRLKKSHIFNQKRKSFEKTFLHNYNSLFYFPKNHEWRKGHRISNQQCRKANEGM